MQKTGFRGRAPDPFIPVINFGSGISDMTSDDDPWPDDIPPLSGQDRFETGPDSDPDSGPDTDLTADLTANLAGRFDELARLGEFLIAAEDRLTTRERDITTLRRDLARARAQLGNLDGMQRDLADKTAALRALDTEVKALRADRAQIDALMDAADGTRTIDGQTAEILRLSRHLLEQETALAAAAEDIARLQEQAPPPDAPAPAPAPTTADNPGALGTARAALTRMQAARDRALIRAGQGDLAACPGLAGPGGGFVVLVTYGLSGDMVLQRVLNRIDGLCLRGENGAVLGQLATAWQAARTIAQTGAQTGDQTDPDDPGRFLWLTGLGWQLAESFVQTVLAPEHDPNPPHILGFREIRWPDDTDGFAAQLDFIHAFFPDVRFIFHSRNHRDVAQSGWWVDQEPETVISMLERRDALFDSYLAAHPTRGLRLHYDDYIADPTRLEPLFDLLGARVSASDLAEEIAGYLATGGAR